MRMKLIEFNRRGFICAFNREMTSGEKEALTREERVIFRAIEKLDAKYFVVMKRISEKYMLVWKYIVTRSTKERTYVRYVNGKKIKHTVKPVLGEKAAHNGKVVYSLDFQVTPHQLRHTYITNLIYASVDPKTVQYLAGHENSKVSV